MLGFALAFVLTYFCCISYSYYFYLLYTSNESDLHTTITVYDSLRLYLNSAPRFIFHKLRCSWGDETASRTLVNISGAVYKGLLQSPEMAGL